MAPIIIYETSEELVTDLKKTLKPYKTLIKSNTNRNQRFPFVSMQKCDKLNKYVQYLKCNQIDFNESIDRKINKICRKYFTQTKESVDSSDTTEEPPLKKKKVVDSLIHLNLISDQNEDLDFEEENSNNGENHSKANSEPKTTNANHLNKLNGFVPKSDYRNTNGSANISDKNGMLSDLNGVPLFNNQTTNFKIPKKSWQSIETIISHAEGMARSNIRPVDAYNYLVRHLTEDQWRREDVRELLISVAKYMVANKDFLANVSKFNQLIDKIKSLEYIDDDFWDQIIYSVDKKKCESKNNHEIDSFLSNLHDFMINHKISARIVCTEAVIIAYRTLTNHPTAKDLIDLQL